MLTSPRPPRRRPSGPASRVRPLAGLAVVLSLAGGCERSEAGSPGGAREQPGAASASSPSSTVAPEGAKPSARPVSPPAEPEPITLEDPGEHPREPLRHGLKGGHTVRWALVVQALTLVGGAPQTLDLGLEVRASVQEVGRERTSVRLTLAELGPIDDPSAAAAWRSLSDRVATMAVSPHGEVTRPPRLDAHPEDVVARQLWASVREALVEAWLPCPDEPVGVGARWTTRRDLVRGGIRLRRLTRYRLRARDELVVVEAEIEETPRPGAYADPDLDGTVTLEALKGTGVGRRRWTAPAAGGFATEASTEVATDLLVRARLTAPDAPPPQDRRVETTQSVSLKATPTAPPLDPPPQTGQNAP